ncbi:MAG: ATP-binding protein, partial [Dehalococcoidia bacterium]
AHEIRNPLSGIKGYAQVIEKKPCDERNSGFARRIVAETRRLETLVSDLLAYARNDRGSMATMDLAEVVSHTADLLRHEAEQLHIDIISQCPEKMLIVGNRDWLGQVLLNLGKNAVQAMPDGGILRITAAAGDKHVIIRVIDNGQGIRQEELPRIFEPFFTSRARGTGLGLALSRKIVEEHGGSIEVQSAVGQGTTVFITIPRRQNHQVRS